MQRIELRIDVSSSVALPGPTEIAATAFLPEPERGGVSKAVIFALPGGGYSRFYFDMKFAGHRGYSEATYHTEHGFIVVALDPIGVGDSSTSNLEGITLEMLGDSYDFAVREITKRLENGTLADGIDVAKGTVKIGIGQSMGGCVTIVAQGRKATFDAIAPLGFSAIHTVLPQRTEADTAAGIANYTDRRSDDPAKLSIADSSSRITDFVYPFHWEDVPRDILDADMAGGYPLRKISPVFGSKTIPNCAIQMMSPGCVAAEAAAVKVPVLIGVGERDVCPSPHSEPGAYPRSQDISVFVAPNMAHMHNFASSRKLLWQRIEAWAGRISN